MWNHRHLFPRARIPERDLMGGRHGPREQTSVGRELNVPEVREMPVEHVHLHRRFALPRSSPCHRGCCRNRLPVRRVAHAEMRERWPRCVVTAATFRYPTTSPCGRAPRRSGDSRSPRSGPTREPCTVSPAAHAFVRRCPHQALNELANVKARRGQVVELRFFTGLSVEETAEVLEVSAETVMRDWKVARAWLFSQLNPTAPAP